MRAVATSSARTVSAAVAAGVIVWLGLLVVSPYLVARATPGGALFTAGGLVYMAGQAVCHQRADRSFHAWGVQLPVCGRCLGLYVGAALGSLLAALFANRTRARADWLLRFTLAAAPTAVSVALEVSGVWAQAPSVRCAAAVPLGFAAGWFVAAHAPDVARRAAGAPQA